LTTSVYALPRPDRSDAGSAWSLSFTLRCIDGTPSRRSGRYCVFEKNYRLQDIQLSKIPPPRSRASAWQAALASLAELH
jgi:hypothetical protein